MSQNFTHQRGILLDGLSRALLMLILLIFFWSVLYEIRASTRRWAVVSVMDSRRAKLIKTARTNGRAHSLLLTARIGTLQSFCMIILCKMKDVASFVHQVWHSSFGPIFTFMILYCIVVCIIRHSNLSDAHTDSAIW